MRKHTTFFWSAEFGEADPHPALSCELKCSFCDSARGGAESRKRNLDERDPFIPTDEKVPGPWRTLEEQDQGSCSGEAPTLPKQNRSNLTD